jgi:hypothetical protein
MTVLFVDQQKLFHFHDVEDMELWMFMHQEEYQDVVVIHEDEYDERFQTFLDENAPVEIIRQ